MVKHSSFTTWIASVTRCLFRKTTAKSDTHNSLQHNRTKPNGGTSCAKTVKPVEPQKETIYPLW